MHKKILAGAVLSALAAQYCEAADDVSLKKDLLSVISLMGLPCGEVVAVSQKAENDSMATCKDGNRYHVYVNAQGRVVADKQ